MTPRRKDVPIHVASLQDKAIREVVGGADGWVPTFWPYKHLKDGRAMIEEGARAAGRDGSKIEIAPFMAIIPFDDAAMARSMIKPLVPFYIGGMGTYSHALFCRYGWEANANEVRDLYNAGKRKEAAAAVADEIVPGVVHTVEGNG